SPVGVALVRLVRPALIREPKLGSEKPPPPPPIPPGLIPPPIMGTPPPPPMPPPRYPAPAPRICCAIRIAFCSERINRPRIANNRSCKCSTISVFPARVPVAGAIAATPRRASSTIPSAPERPCRACEPPSSTPAPAPLSAPEVASSARTVPAA
ncbi:hypothetical protein D2E41_26935, partial [Mycobacteroides abscessus]